MLHAVAHEAASVVGVEVDPLDHIDHRTIRVGHHEVPLAELTHRLEDEPAAELVSDRRHGVDVVDLERHEQTARPGSGLDGNGLVARLHEGEPDFAGAAELRIPAVVHEDLEVEEAPVEPRRPFHVGHAEVGKRSSDHLDSMNRDATAGATPQAPLP